MEEIKKDQLFGVISTPVLHAEYSETSFNDEGCSFFYGAHKRTHVIEKELCVVLDADSGKVSYYVGKKEDYTPCYMEPHGNTLFSKTYDNKEDAIEAYNSLKLEM